MRLRKKSDGGAKIAQRDGQLRVTGGKGTPFLVKNGLALDGAFKATIECQIWTRGHVRIAWREAGQKDFVKGHNVSTIVGAPRSFQTVELDVPAKGKTIHIRVHLPTGQTSIKKITLEASNKTESWDFTK